MHKAQYTIVASIVSEIGNYVKRRLFALTLAQGLEKRFPTFNRSKWFKACKVIDDTTTK